MKKNVLIIDDDAAVRKSFKLALEDFDYNVDLADCGEVGVDLVKQEAYDLVYLDLKMPGMNGVETLREIRKKKPKLPVYIITAFHEEYFDQLKSANGEGIQFEILRKPIGMNQISSITRSILDEK